MTGHEPRIGRAAGAAVAGLANLLTDIVQEKGRGLLGRTDRPLNDLTQPAISNISEGYMAQYSDRHCQIRILGIGEPIRLESVYTDVRLGEADLQSASSIADLEATYRNHRERRLQQRFVGETQTGIALANAEPLLMVLGSPGSGKTTFLRRTGLEALKGSQGAFDHPCVPVFVELKRLPEFYMNLEQLIAHEFQSCGFSDAPYFTAQALRKGELLILLDGLDEIPLHFSGRAVQTIRDFVSQYAQNRYIISCRTAAYRATVCSTDELSDGFSQFRVVTIAEFDDEQIQQFIHNWFASKPNRRSRTTNQFWEALQRAENAGTKEIAHTPLLLTFLCSVYERLQSFPTNRSILYRKVLWILSEAWAIEHDAKGDESDDRGLPIELQEILLADIAARSLVKNQLFFSRRDILGRVKTFLKGNLNAPRFFNSEAILESIAQHQGILVERTEEVYSFSHLSLQEYLAAQHFVNNPHLIKQMVSKYLLDEQWREIFLLIAGSLRRNRGVDELLLRMEQQILGYIVDTAKLHPWLQWAEKATAGSNGKYHPVAKRVAALFLVLDLTLDLNLTPSLDLALALDLTLVQALKLIRTLDLDLHLTLERDRTLALALNYDARSLSPHLALARALDRARFVQETGLFTAVDTTQLISAIEALKAQLPDDFQPLYGQQAFADQLLQLWLDALDLTLEVAKLSAAEAQKLSDYLYGNELMVKSKETAMLVTPEIWAGIEERMLKARAE